MEWVAIAQAGRGIKGSRGSKNVLLPLLLQQKAHHAMGSSSSHTSFILSVSHGLYRSMQR